MDDLTKDDGSGEEAAAFQPPGTCWSEMSGRLDEAQTKALIALQVQLCGQQLRGSMADVRRWIDGGDLCNCVLGASRGVGLFVAEEMLIKPSTAFVGDTFAPFLSPYGFVHELMDEDYLFLEWRWARVAGSCFLVAPDKIMTAAHVMGFTARRLMARRELLVVFDFQADVSGGPPAVMSKHRSVFTVLGIDQQGANQDAGSDWITLKLDRPVTDSSDRPFLRVSSGEPNLSRAVYSLGHPKAIALRYGRSREAWSSNVAHCFEAHLDAYDGISGAPVFDAESHMVVGMMIRSCPTARGIVPTHADRNLSPLCYRDDRRCGAVIISSKRFAGAI